MRKSKLFFIVGLFLVFFSTVSVSASEFTPNTNLFENTYSNNLIDMANNQIENFSSKNFVIFQIDYDYYLVCSDNVSVNSNNLVFTDSTIIRAIRTTSGGYNSYYDYSTITESNTVVNLSNVVISNIKANNTISSSKFNDYKFNHDITYVGTFILGIIFALFVTKERRF